MYNIKQSTAITIPFFAHDAAGDAVTGLTNVSFTKRISKNGGAFAAMTVVITEMENGWYSIPLSASHSDTNGLLTIVFTNAGAKQVNLQWRVQTRLIDDLAFPTVSGRSIDVEATGEVGIDLDNTVGALGTSDFDADYLDNSLLADDVIAAEQIAANSIGASELAADAIGASQLATDAVEEIADQVWDEVLTGATHAVVDSSGRRLRDLQEFGVYEGGAVWIDILNGSPGTTDFESGTAFNPVDNINDANTIAASLGLTRFEIAPGSIITFLASQDGQIFNGNDWTLALGGQSVSGTHIIGAEVSGIATSANELHFENCEINNITVGMAHFTNCGLSGTITLSAATTYTLNGCYSEIAGAGNPIIDFGAGVLNTNLNVRSYSGSIQIESMGDMGTDTMSLEGWGEFVEGTCTGGVVNISGNFTLSGITNLTISDDGRIDVDQIGDAAWDELIAGHLGVGSTGEALNNATAPTAADVADAVWDELIAGHVDVGSFGEEVQAHSTSAEVAGVQSDTDNIQTRLPAVLVGGRMDSSVGALVANIITAAAIDTGAIDADSLALDAGQEIADRILARNIGSGSDGGRTIQDALRILRNRRADAVGTLTVFEEDDATPAWTAVTTRAAGNPITEVDPA